MNKIIYFNKELIIDKNQFIRQMHLEYKSVLTERCCQLINQAQQLAQPAAAVMVVEAQRTSQKILLQNICFSEQFFATIKDEQQIFVFLATCGHQIDELKKSQTSMLERFWVDRIAQMALHSVFVAAEQYLMECYNLPLLRHICPGATLSWQLEGQKELFSLMAVAAAKLQITLTDDFFMQPDKSLSGIFFISNDHELITDCGYCQQQRCDKKHCPYKVECF